MEESSQPKEDLESLIEPKPAEDDWTSSDIVDEPQLLESEVETEPSADQVVPEVKDESKARTFLRKLIRWSAGLLIVFGLGLILGIFVLYRPATQDIKQVDNDLSAANTQIEDLKSEMSELEARIDYLQSLEDDNNRLLAEQTAFNLHVAILDARVDVANAVLALQEEDTAQARIILDKTSGTLDTISTLLEPELQDAVTAMKQRMELVMSEMEADPYAAQSDLDVLATKLLELEDGLFE